MLRPFAAEGLHQDGFNQRFDVGFAGVVRAKCERWLSVQGAFKQRAHDAGLDELPVRFGRVGQDARNSASVSSKTVESSNRWPLKWRILSLPNVPPLAMTAKSFSSVFGKMFRVVNAGLGNFREQVFRQQAGVLGKETKDDAIEEPGDAEIFLLGDVDFLAGFGVGQFHAFAALQRPGDFGDLRGQVFGDLRPWCAAV